MYTEGSRRKKARTFSRGASAESGEDGYAENDADMEVDIDGDIEDTRFLPEPPPAATRSPVAPAGSRRRLSSSAASSSKVRVKESKPTKGKSSGKKRRQVVWTDDEDDEFDDPEVVVTDDDDFDPEPEYSSSKKAAKTKNGKLGTIKVPGKGKTMKEKDEKQITFRDERKLPSSAQEPPKRPKLDESMKSSSSLVADPIDEAIIPKKRKLPPIKKNKPSAARSTAPSTPSTAQPLVEKKESLLAAPTSNQVGTRKPAGASSDINLLDSSVYSELFKSTPGASTPNSGLNRKQKEEERRKELNKMREDARAKREADAKNAFDLQAAPEKIERFVLQRLRHSTARFPNVLGAAFKEMHDRNRTHGIASERR
ncbi:hypothetical protein C8Q79DRAFT_907956 [Trametes meyenii]|nr:hypothetical protein C8Q79DRAFT_907956 [Trametes meyenii]